MSDQKKITKKNPWVAAILSLFFGPFGYIYLGFNFFVSGVVIMIIIAVLLTVFNYAPQILLFKYLVMLIWAYWGYKFAKESEITDRSVYKSFKFSFASMIYLMFSIIQLYAAVVAIYYIITFISSGKIIRALLMIFLGFGIIQWTLSFFSGLVYSGIMKFFDKSD